MRGFSPHPKPNKKKKTVNLSIKDAINKAATFQSAGNLKEASLIYEKLLHINCKHPNFLSNYAVLLKNNGEYKKAKDLLEQGIKLYPENSFNYSNLSLVFFKQFKFQDALKSINKALLLEPDNHGYLYNLGLILYKLNELEQAKSVFMKVIRISPKYHKAYAELAITFCELGELDNAEEYIRKAIKFDKENRSYFSNLASILTSKGQLDEAGEMALKAISYEYNNPKPLYILSNSKNHYKNEEYLKQLFSKRFEKGLLDISKIDLFFARANILHRERNYSDAANYLSKANNIKLSIYPSDAQKYENVVNKLLNLSSKLEYSLDKKFKDNCVFIVGMPRSGSTLTESIISMNDMVFDLGEARFLEIAFQETFDMNDIHKLSEMRQVYYEQINKKIGRNINQNLITTDKQLYNFAYTALIISQIPEAKIIHCIRHPLDNILSIYRAHFANESRYSSSLIDCVKLYTLQDKVMKFYKSKFKNKIYTLDYDLLVSSPNQEIKQLIDWLGWEWNDCYLNPHLNKRNVTTASNISVRSPINSKSIGGWRNYKKLLKPAIDELLKSSEYQYLLID